MPDYHVIISDEEEKALLTDMISIEEWIGNAIHNKARRMIDLIVSSCAKTNPNTLTVEGKLKIIKGLKLETAAERQKKQEKELAGG